MGDVRVGGLTFEEWPRNPDRAYVISPRSFTGWRGGGQVRREDAPRPLAHGSFSAPGFLAARTISLSGTIIAPTASELSHMCDKLEALLVGVESSRLSVQEDDGRVTWADVGLAMQGQAVPFGDGQTADFQIQFWAPDPFRYGETLSYGPASSVQVFHYGGIPVEPVITVPNGAASYTITSPGGSFSVSGITSGGTHRVDMRTGWVYRNNVLVEGVGVGNTWTVPPGLPWTHSISTGTLSVAVTEKF